MGYNDIQGPACVSWAFDTNKAFDIYGQALTESSQSLVHTTKANYRRDFRDLTTHTGGRPGLRSSDFDWFRPGQSAPTKAKDIIAYGRYVYRRVGLIHNAIDLMGDFACQGIRLTHRNPKVANFYNAWFEQVGGKKVSERLGHLLFREANVPIRSYTAKLNVNKRVQMQQAVGKEEVKFNKDDVTFNKKEIPWRYSFLDPLLIEPLGGSLSVLSNKKILKLELPHSLKRQIQDLRRSNNPVAKEVLDKISPDILRAVDQEGAVILPPDKTYLYHYRKDDWDTWADPITYSAFEPLNLYQRLQLADKAALDGAISKIRVWKLGNIEAKLAPTPTAASTLANMLGANVGGGTIDIVWGPDIELIETSSDVQQFLGEEKYRPTLMAIYATLGIPPTLTGTVGTQGTTNNFISLKTLVERLNYVRDIIIEFWTEQIRLVQKSMGFRFPAQIEFDYMYLEDPAAMGTLLMNMADRNIVSDELVQRYVKAKPNVENRRVKRENDQKDEKVSPFHQVDQDHALKKIALQSGITTPSEVGLKLEEKRKGEKSALELKQKNSGPPAPNKKVGLPGRPKNSPDTQKRKEKIFKPKIKASAEIWAKDAQTNISSLLNPVLVQSFKKTSMRQLTAAEFNTVEKIKFEILCSLTIGDEVDKNTIAQASEHPIPHIHREFELWIQDIDRKLTIDQIRDLRISYCLDRNFNE